jgi:hypothetical protein
MFACLLGKYNLVHGLSYNGSEWNLRPNEEYCYGTSMSITPFIAICQGYVSKIDNSQLLLDLFLDHSDYNICHESIPQAVIDYIAQKEKYKYKISINSVDTKFQDYSDLELNINQKNIYYVLEIIIHDHTISFPFYFENDIYNKIINKTTNYYLEYNTGKKNGKIWY